GLGRHTVDRRRVAREKQGGGASQIEREHLALLDVDPGRVGQIRRDAQDAAVMSDAGEDVTRSIDLHGSEVTVVVAQHLLRAPVAPHAEQLALAVAWAAGGLLGLRGGGSGARGPRRREIVGRHREYSVARGEGGELIAREV